MLRPEERPVAAARRRQHAGLEGVRAEPQVGVEAAQRGLAQQRRQRWVGVDHVDVAVVGQYLQQMVVVVVVRTEASGGGADTKWL
eukprot:262297-Chlamydomonas_euryale.AAC.1